MSSKRKDVLIYCDGGCRGNGEKDALGAYGVVIMTVDKEHTKELKAAFAKTTNNQMELAGAIAGLSELKMPCNVQLFSDSAYLINAFKLGWIESWQKNGWKTANKGPVKNRQMWETLLALTQKHNVTFVKVKGHSDNKNNNRCDELVNEAMDEFKENS